MEKEERELLEKLVKEVATQNKLIALLLCQKDFLKFNSTDVEIESSFNKYIQN